MENEARSAKIRILRFNPQTDREPYNQDYTIPLADDAISILQALNQIYEQQDATLAFRQYCCGIQNCNSCIMNINGKAAHACKTLVSAGMEFEVAPLHNKTVIRDLIAE